MFPPPGLLSTTTCCPSARDSLSAISRQMISGVPPAACETMNLIGRAGQLCAAACSAAVSNASRARQCSNQSVHETSRKLFLTAALPMPPTGGLVGRAFSVLQAAHDTIRSYRVVDLQDRGMTSNPPGGWRRRARAIDVHAHVIVPEVYAVAAEHNIFSELPTDPGVTDEMRSRSGTAPAWCWPHERRLPTASPRWTPWASTCRC